jgi:hypothetical protein
MSPTFLLTICPTCPPKCPMKTSPMPPNQLLCLHILHHTPGKAFGPGTNTAPAQDIAPSTSAAPIQETAPNTSAPKAAAPAEDDDDGKGPWSLVGKKGRVIHPVLQRSTVDATGDHYWSHRTKGLNVLIFASTRGCIHTPKI